MANTVTGRPDVELPGWISASVRRPLAIFLLAMLLGSCGQSAPEVTLNYLRPGWPLLDPTELPLLQQFTRETGIQLKTLPFPENSLDQLDLSRKLLQEGSSGPDVLGIDLIWSGVLEGDLTDLRPYLAAEISALKPQWVGRLWPFL